MAKKNPQLTSTGISTLDSAVAIETHSLSPILTLIKFSNLNKAVQLSSWKEPKMKVPKRSDALGLLMSPSHLATGTRSIFVSQL